VPGTDLLRSELNFVLLAAIAEAVTGQTLAEAFRTRIAAPLGMDATWLLGREPPPDGVALAAAQLGDTDITGIPALVSYDAGSAWATNTADLGRFLQALAADELGDGAIKDQMFTTHANYIGVADYGLGGMVRSGDCILPNARLMGSLSGGAFALIVPERQSMVWGFNSRLDYFGMGYAADLLEAVFGAGTCRDAGSWVSHASGEAAGFSSTELAQVDEFLQGTDTSAFIAITDGKVLYQYGQPGRRYASHSIRKVFLSALYDIEVKSGLIDMDSTMGELGITDLTPLTPTEQTATVRDLMKARSGIYLPAAGSSDNDPLPPRGSAAPGEQWFYNNWDFNALATVYEEATGDSLFDRFISDIGERLGMEDIRRQDQIYLYERLLSDHPMYMFNLTARDMARFGQLYLEGGLAQGKRILRASWVTKSTTSYSDTGSATRPGFGYMNWSILDNGYMGTGSGGHKILVMPDENLVVVIRVDTYNDGHHVSDNTFNQAVQMILDARQ
jgi:CubicO group peptidase (beta-lactamase class C family)